MPVNRRASNLVIFLLFAVLLFSLSAHAQTPDTTNGTPPESFAGEPFCFSIDLENVGLPGFGPYHRLILPPEISFDSATFLGSAVTTAVVGTFPASPANQLIDPRTGTAVTGPDGGSLTLLVLPLGSVVQGGPIITTEVCATIATTAIVGVPLDVTVQTVYEFGDTPTGDNGPIIGTAETVALTPTVIRITKNSNVSEGERVPGPVFTYTYTLTVDVANGKSVFDHIILDTLDADIQYAGGLSITGGVNCSAVTTPSLATPGGTLRVQCDRVDGTLAGNDLVITYNAYIIDTLDETNCTAEPKTNTVTLDAEHPDNNPLPQILDDAEVTAKHLAIQKGAAPGSGRPGDTVTYTVNFQLSQFATANSLVITDLLPDGVTFVSHGSLTVNSGPVAIVPTVTPNVDGTTTLVYDVHAVTGDLGPASTGTLVYTATIDQDFTPAPDPILASDSLSNTIDAAYSLTAGASGCADGSGATVGIIPVNISKSIINPQPQYVPGETVTYRLTLEIPSGDTESIVFEDFFPLPVFDVTTLDLTFGNDITLAPTDTLGLTPTAITIDAAANSLRIVWPNVNTTTPEIIAVDVSIVVEDDPFADGLFLTNLFQASTNNSPGETAIGVSPVQILVRAPDLVLTKGISASDNPAAAATINPSPATLPVDGNIAASDAGDTITFTTTVENIGGAPAFDVTITDPTVAGLESCAVLTVTDGMGAPLVSSGSLFGAGLVLTDPLAANDGSPGAPFSDDTALITYTCEIADGVTPRAVISNTASVIWASQSGAVVFPAEIDGAMITIAGPAIAKTISAVAPGGAGGGLVSSGDTVTYVFTVTLPEGTTPDLTLTDTLPPGFEYVAASASVDITGFNGTVDTSPTVGTSGAVATGQTVSITFDSPANTSVTSDNNPANNSFIVEIQALVRDLAANDGLPTVQNKTNAVSLNFSGNPAGAVTDSVAQSFAEPQLAVTKAMSPNSGLDAGDTVTITLTVDNTGTSPAYDIVVTDILNDNGQTLFDLSSVAEGTTSAGFSFNYTSPTVTYTGAGPLAAGASVMFTFTARVRADVVTGSSFNNTASVSGDSQPGNVAEERTTSDDDTVSAAVASVSTAKALIASSEPWTSNNGPPVAAIGEVLSYQATFDIPEGVTTSPATAIITDTLPAGFQYRPGTAMIRAVVDTGISGSLFGPIPTVNTPVIPNVNGQTLEFDLGSLTNSDADVNVEQILLTYDVLVLNTTVNNRDNLKTNTVRLNYLNNSGNPQSRSATVNVRIGEPSLAISKTANPTSVSGGDTVTFTVVLTNQNVTRATRAWEPTLSDMLPADYQSPAVSSATLSRGSLNITACAGFTGNTLNLGTACIGDPNERYIGPGENITVVYTATVAPSVAFEQQINNTVEAESTSLPGSNGAAAPGAPDSSTGERTGSGNLNELTENVNDLAVMASAAVTVNRPTVVKTGDASLQIGDTTLMTVEISVPTGTTSSFVLTDTLPGGLVYTGTPISITLPAANFTTSNSPGTTPGAGTNPLVFDFGDVTNSAATAQSIVIQYQVQLANILSNQNTSPALVNSAVLNFAGASMPLPADTAMITVIEPNLQIVKTITAGAAGSDAGDTVSYRVELSNTDASATAYRVALNDLLPAELLGAPDGSGSAPFFLNIAITNPGDTVVLNADGVTPLAAGDAQIITTSTADDTLSWPLFDLPPSTTLTITYDAVVANTAIAGNMLSNQVSASYHSLADGDPAGRDGSDPASDDDDNGDLDNYNETGGVTLTLASTIAIQKVLSPSQADANFTIGEAVLYDLRIDFVEGITNNVVVTDTLPAGLQFEALVATLADPNISFDGPGIAVEAPAGTITIDLGTITNPADGNSSNDFITLRLQARVLDVPGNSQGQMLTNTASATTDSGSAGPATLDITIVEPNLEILKQAATTMPSLGDPLRFTVTVRHNASTADAFDVVLADILPAGLTYIPGSVLGAAIEVGGAPVFDLGTITLAEVQKVFSFEVTVDSDATVGADLVNTINGAYSSLPGTPAIEREYSGSGNETVTPTAPAFIEAVKTVAIATDGGVAGQVDPGDTLEYTITLDNTGPAATGVVFSDTIPANTSYVGGSLMSSVGTADDSGAPDLVVTIGNLAAAATVTITFQVTVDAGTPAGTIISNQGVVDSEQTVPEPTDSDGVDANGDQPTDITVGGAPGVTNALYVQKLVSWLIDADASGDITAGDTLRYFLVFENLGNQTLTNVSLSDTLPAGLTYVAASASISGGNTINVVGSNVSVAIAGLGAGGVEIAQFDVTIDVFAGMTATFTNQGTIDSDQTAASSTDSNGDPSDGNQPTEISAVNGIAGSPAIDVEKRWALAVDSDGDGLVDPGDTLGYTITIRNTGSAIAENVRLSDTIPANTSVVGGSASTSAGVIVSEDPLQVNIGFMDPGDLVTVSFDVTVDGGTADGTIIANQASVSGDNFAAEPSDDNGSDADGKNPTLTPVDSGGGSGVGSPSGLSKTLQASSEAASSASQVFIGEVVTFRSTVAVPAGVLREVTLSDTLPTGLSYLAGTARVARSFDTGLNSSQDPGGVNSTASDVFVNLVDGIDVIITGQDIDLFLGDVINSDNDVDSETYTLEIQAVVENIAGNQAGDDLVNQAQLSFLDGLGQPANLTPVNNTVTVIESNPQISKTASPTAILPTGGDVTFTITISNPASGFTATAFDINITDMLAAEYTALSVDSITPSGGVSGVTDNTTGTTLDVDVAVFPPDGQLVIVMTATAPGPLTPGTLTNSTTAVWTSLPGAQGTASATPGNPGDVDGERTGSGSESNDYSAFDSADVEIGNPSITKTVLNAQTRYAIGDPVTYRLDVTLPATAALDNVVVQDILDEGLSYVSGTLNLQFGAGLSASNNPADFTRTDNNPMPGQETLSLSLGTLSNTSGAVGTLIITYDVLVDNILSNQDNQTLGNNASLSFDDPGGGAGVVLDDMTSVTLGEPVVTLAKAIVSPSAGLDAGDTVDFQIDVGNSGTTTAFEVVLDDVLPMGLENVTNLMVVSASGGAETPTLSNNGSDWSSSGFDVPVGGSVRIAFTAQLATSVIPGQSIQNQVTASFTSRDGADANERDGATPGSVQSDDSDLNNYNEAANAPTIIVADPVQLDKAFTPDPTNTTYTIGETVIYRLSISLLEGTTNDLVVSDTLPANVRFVNAVVGLGNMGMTTGFTPPPQQVGQVLTFDFGDVINPANGNAGDDVITIDLNVIIENVLPDNQAGAVLGNNASLSFNGPSGTVTREFDDDAAAPGIQPLELTIVEPDVQILKTANPSTVPPGDLVTFTVVLDHTVSSSADAFDLQIVDTLPAGLSYVSGSASIPVTVSGQVLTFDIAALTLADDQTSFTYRALVEPGVTFGAPLSNAVALSYTSQPGVNADERSYSDSGSATVIPDVLSFIEAAKTVAIALDGGTIGQVDPGDRLEYAIVLENQGSDVTGVVFSDTIPANTSYVGGSLMSSVGTADDSGAPDLVVTIGNLAAAATVTITFQVTVDAGTPAGTIISNQGVVDSEQTVPEPTDSDGVDANGDQPTDIIVGGPDTGVPASLYLSKSYSLSNDLVAPAGTINEGDQVTYSVVISNTGGVPLTGVIFTDNVPTGANPPGMAVTAITTSQGTAPAATNNIAIDDIGTIAVGGSVTITITGIVNGTGNVVNQAGVTSNETATVDSDGNGDPTDGNQETIFPVLPAGEVGQPLLSLSKSVTQIDDGNSDDRVNPGETVRFTLRVRNDGNANAVNVRITDDLSTIAIGQLIAGSVRASQGIVVAEQPEIMVNLGTLGPGGQAIISFDMTATAVGQLTNIASLSCETADIAVALTTTGCAGQIAEAQASIPVEQFVLFDPPFGQKIVTQTGPAELEWGLFWINPNATYILPVSGFDPIPANAVFVDGSLVCEASGASTITRCEFDAANNRVVYTGLIAPDPGASDPSDADNEITIIFRTTVLNTTQEVSNQASTNWDDDGNGDTDDDISGGQDPALSDDPSTSAPDDPTVWTPGQAIPTLSLWGMLLLSLWLAILGGRLQRQRR